MGEGARTLLNGEIRAEGPSARTRAGVGAGKAAERPTACLKFFKTLIKL